jgi:hypothetical protein
VKRYFQNSLLVYVLFGIFIKCNSSESVKPDYTNSTQYAVIPFDTSYVWIFKNVKPSSLSASEIKVIDMLIKNARKEYNQKIPGERIQIRALSEYKIQLIPVINQNGQKEVYVNGLCETYRENWRNHLIEVKDGGNCFFSMKINLAKGNYFEVGINGDA